MDGVPSGVHWLVLWWHLQRLYAGLFDDEMEASLHAATRNGVVVELVGIATVGEIHDWWRRDDQGRPMPGEWRTPRILQPTDGETLTPDRKASPGSHRPRRLARHRPRPRMSATVV